MSESKYLEMTLPAEEEKIGSVIEALPNALFRIALEDGDEISAYLSGKMRMHRIRVLVGDRVRIKMDTHGGKANRITQRL